MDAACWLIAAVVAVMNVAGAALAVHDKRAATTRAGRRDPARRVPERLFRMVAVLGGWPATGLALLLLRHKTRKPLFLLGFAFMAALGTAGLAGWLLALGCL